MTTLFVFALALFATILVSALADRTVLSVAVLFLLAGFLAGPGVLGFIGNNPSEPMVQSIAMFALCSVLFTDGMRAGIDDLRRAWRLPGRALLLGLPLTLLATAGLGYLLAGLSWMVALLVGAILSPTDPVFASAIVGRKDVPERLRFLLNVESGVNDGLALPIVVVLLSIIGHQEFSFPELGGELLLGVAIGVMLPLLACWLERRRIFEVSKTYEALFVLSIGLLVLTLAHLTHGNVYLATFAAGVTIASVRPDLRDHFHEFGELIAELLKLGALLLFGAMITPSYFIGIGLGGFVFAVLALILARPAGLLLSLIGSQLDWRERVTAAWFGPKGFASVIYALLLFQYYVPDAERVFHLIAVVITGSMIAHASTDVLVARWFVRAREREAAA